MEAREAIKLKMMSKACLDFVDEVIKLLPKIDHYDAIEPAIKMLFLKGYSVADAYEHAMCWEEFNVSLTSDEAFVKMAELVKKYKV